MAYLDVLPSRPTPLGREPLPPFAAEYEQIRQRVMRATTRILVENSEGQILVIAHAGTLGTMVRGIMATHALLVHTDQAAVHSLCWWQGRWALQYLNFREHLANGVQVPGSGKAFERP